ncbi:MAG TPA: DUF6585 family protein [Ktedonobacterales bacterium]|nr:DUF6585 family protein [Ktedonobacterales bacterium]
MTQQPATPTLPPAAHELAERYQLGAPQAEYQRWLRPAGIVTSVLLALGGIFFLTIFAPSVARDGTDWPSIIIGLLLLAGAFIWPISFLININQRVYLCAKGLVQVKGKRVDVVRWDQVEWVVDHVVRRAYSLNNIPLAKFTTHVYKVRRTDGVKLTFRDSLRNVESLGETMVWATTRHLIPRAIATYNSGVPVPFGDLTVSKEGISKGKKLLPWDRYDHYEIKEGDVLLWAKGKFFVWKRFPERKLHNALVFSALLDYRQNNQRRAAR